MNVILILADQLSAKWLKCYGNPAAHTPNLDAIAARGALFNNCYSPNPVCMPARASIITGRSAQHHSVFYNGYELGTDIPTYPGVLQQNNIQTFGIGKFHLECHGRGTYNDVNKYGFDRVETTEDIRSGHWLDWVKTHYPEYYEPALSTVWYEPHLENYGSDKIDLRPALMTAKEKYPVKDHAPMTRTSIIPEVACQTTWITNRAIDFIDERNPQRPFFMNVSYVDPHDPYDPPQRFLDLIDRDAIPRPIRSADGSLQDMFAGFAANIPFIERFSTCDEEQWITMRHHYLASLAFVDEQIGRLQQHLEATGLADDTLIIFSADHGDMLGDHNYPTKGAWHFDACARVPLLVSGSGVQPGKHSKMVSLLDLFPTIIDYAGANSAVPVEGNSLRPLLENSGSLPRPDAVIVESYGSYGNIDPALTAKSLITQESHYYRLGDGQEMLFDRTNDPAESTNLASNASEKPHKEKLRKLMLEMLSRQNMPLPLRNRHPFAAH
jgi:arylsulfatase A-like enzyme